MRQTKDLRLFNAYPMNGAIDVDLIERKQFDVRLDSMLTAERQHGAIVFGTACHRTGQTTSAHDEEVGVDLKRSTSRGQLQ